MTDTPAPKIMQLTFQHTFVNAGAHVVISMADGLCALLLLLLLLLCAPARSDRTSLSVRFVNSDAARPVLLHWKRPTGELKRWSELQPRTDSSVKSFSGDTWVVTDAADTGVVVREILLDVANGNPQVGRGPCCALLQRLLLLRLLLPLTDPSFCSLRFLLRRRRMTTSSMAARRPST